MKEKKKRMDNVYFVDTMSCKENNVINISILINFLQGERGQQ